MTESTASADNYFKAVEDGDLKNMKEILTEGRVQAGTSNKVWTLSEGASLNTLINCWQDGHQAVHIAIRRGHIEIVEYLLDEEGVSPRAEVKVGV